MHGRRVLRSLALLCLIVATAGILAPANATFSALSLRSFAAELHAVPDGTPAWARTADLLVRLVALIIAWRAAPRPLNCPYVPKDPE